MPAYAARGTRGDVALGHCMRKLLHLAFAVWKKNEPFDKHFFKWQIPFTKPQNRQRNKKPQASSGM